LIGQKRFGALGPARLVACADVDLGRAQALAANTPGAVATHRWEDAVCRQDVDLVIVSTTNRFLAEISRAAIREKKHVLVEKPAARTVSELEGVMAEAVSSGVKVRVGFNHRYHPALRKARHLFAEGLMGEMMFLRGRYGHGGRIGYEKEWRADPVQAGGGRADRPGCPLD